MTGARLTISSRNYSSWSLRAWLFCQLAGLEVDAVTPAGAALTGVVVAEVLDVVAHPDAERLSVCRVSDGVAEYQVVCGASNVRPGLRVPFAREGAALPGLTIRCAKLRGVESSGMLCAAAELGIESRGDGLLELPPDAPLGDDIVAYLRLADRVIELGLTPNRGDCLGIAGLVEQLVVGAVRVIKAVSDEDARCSAEGDQNKNP